MRERIPLVEKKYGLNEPGGGNQHDPWSSGGRRGGNDGNGNRGNNSGGDNGNKGATTKARLTWMKR